MIFKAPTHLFEIFKVPSYLFENFEIFVVPTHFAESVWFDMAFQQNASELVIVHPSLLKVPASLGMSGKYEYSYEFLIFLRDLQSGGVSANNPMHRRNWEIAQRLACYPIPLIHQIGHLTSEGQIFADDAKQALSHFTTYYHKLERIPPTWDKADQMDEIVLNGTISNEGIQLLRELYLLVENRQFPDIDVYYRDWQLATQFYDNKQYALVNPLRSRVRRMRGAIEDLIKFGLIHQRNLGRRAGQTRGRLPVGICLTTSGIRFFEHYLQEFDNQAKLQISKEIPNDYQIP